MRKARVKKDEVFLFTPKEVSINGLFERFNHRIPLAKDSRVTIIHGPNGTGKSTILGMLDALRRKDVNLLETVPFKSFDIGFDEGIFACVKENEDFDFSFTGSKEYGNGSNFKINNESFKKKSVIRLIDWFFRESRKYGIFGEEMEAFRISRRSLVFLDRDDSLDWGSAARDLVWRFLREKEDRIPLPREFQRMREVLDGFPFLLIPAHRLFEEVVDSVPSGRRTKKTGERKKTTRLKVQGCSENLEELMTKAKTEFGELSQKLDRTFVSQVLEQRGRDAREPPTKEQIILKATEIEDKYHELMAAGLLEGSETPRFGPDALGDEAEDPIVRLVLDVHYENLERKLEEFDILLEKLALLTSILNEHYRYLGKRIHADSQSGLVVSLHDNSQLPLSKLSSGEQHILVLLYELIFEAKSGTVVMIDEPELSLHPSWQFRFVPDLRKIGDQSKLGFILATHSPQIINNDYDIAIGLEVSEI